ncbi:hypothetical protein [Streptomyces sp. NPDC096013]|uniref:SCO2400 family protein n=1 Tax=Streptomyces sp. NPDC096013 TaxID=3366069 RepID=UPI00380BE63A
MDYCTSCRRHLNGALVCPGCGAYAPDIEPAITHDHGTQATRTLAAPFRPEPDAYDSVTNVESIEEAEDVTVDEAAIPLSDGRAARRRQQARWKKTQRRALVATAVALVGGGLTVAATGRGSGHDTSRTTAATDLSSLDVGPTTDQPDGITSTGPGTGKHRKSSADDTRSPATDGGYGHVAGTAPRSVSEAHSTAARHPTPTPTTRTSTASTLSADSATSSTDPATATATQPSSSPAVGDTTSDSAGSTSSSGSSSSQSSADSSQSSSSQSSTGSSAGSPSEICVLGLLCVS